jgi:alkaline phosphatase D
MLLHAALPLAALATLAPLAPQDEPRLVGPVLGQLRHDSVAIWTRVPEPGKYTVAVTRRTTGSYSGRTTTAEIGAENDLCRLWTFSNLEPDTLYHYTVASDGELLAGGETCSFRTPREPDLVIRTRLAFGSCASSEPSSVWSVIGMQSPDGLVLLGDTPYIDTTDLDAARAKHRRFLEVPELAALIRSVPVWATWDDHDFGGNDSDGTLEGKERTRQAFVEYRVNATFGEDDEGIYTSFRRGPIEVFLLDTRYFARTEPAAPGSDLPTLLGAKQWAWLERGLVASEATFKVIACGMIWDDKGNTESDDWGSYPHERERLERFLGEKKISGVVLVGGDIHCSRHLRYPGTKERVGYVLDQLIVSPLHDGVIESLDVPHPALLWSAREPRVFLTLEARGRDETPRLEARWIQDDGRGAGRELRRVRWTLDDLRQE